MEDEDFTLDFTGVNAPTGYSAIPSGWYKCEITGFDDTETGPNSKKLKPGTPGTNWEFTVSEGKHEGAKLWTKQWHVDQSLPYIKGLFKASGAFTNDELSKPLSGSDRERLVGQELWVKVKFRPETDQWDETNDVKGFKHIDERKARSEDDDASLMP